MALVSTDHALSSKTGKPNNVAPEIMKYKYIVDFDAAEVYSFMKVILDAAKLVEVIND